MKVPETQTELQDLFSRVCDEQASEQELSWLNTALCTDPRVRCLYWEFMAAEVEIQSWIGESDGDSNRQSSVYVDFERVFAAPVVVSNAEEPHDDSSSIRVLDWRRNPVRFAMTLAAMAAAVGGIGLGLFWNRPADNALQTAGIDSQRRPPVATVVQNINAEWADTALSVEEGSVLKQHQVLQLASGFSVVKFTSGARVVLSGPSTFVVTGPNEGSLEVGELTARVTPESHGFRVLTPQATIVDLGTQFGVHVDPDGTGVVEVFEGTVELLAEHAVKPVRLTSGAVSSLRGGTSGSQGGTTGQLATDHEFVPEQLLPSQDLHAPVIHANSNNVFQLHARASKQWKANDRRGYLPFRNDKNEYPTWDIAVEEDREFQVSLKIACTDANAGGSYLLMVDGKALGEGKTVSSTGAWKIYERSHYGDIKLSKGRHTVSVISRIDRTSHTKLVMHLRSIILMPIE